MAGHPRLRALGPSTAAIPATEALRAGAGAIIGLAAAAGLAIVIAPEFWLGIYLIAPFGATSVLIFAAPNSPLAQPWPAIVGNTMSALVALLICRLTTNPLIAVPASVGVAIMAMALCRATHPPGGAVAMTVAIGADKIAPLGLGFAFLPVMVGTTLLVGIAVLYAHATGRRYPFRQFGEPNPNGTADPAPPERLGLTEDELSRILVRYNQSLNLGVEDLARLLAAAEMQAASHRTKAQTTRDIMSRDLVTVAPDTPLLEVAALFSRHGFTSLPVVGPDGRYLGVIFQLHLIARTHAQFRPDGRLSRAGGDLRAADVMGTRLPTARPDTPIAALLPQLASSDTDAVPVLEDGRIVGIVTRTDLVAALARESLRRDDD
ncbi:HPP family protein [Paracoccus fontiphilus]|uniref:HPP family protein n=1 Tax=Paracoccus fontiphilus TaxID=1815556 RepID=A0ABV7IF03_9RHOB|nr:HPP family protein [Paracoccus fontiphilus]